VVYHELLAHPRQLLPLFTHDEPPVARIMLRAGFRLLQAGMRRRFGITAEAAEHSRAKTVAAMDRLEREISSNGFLVGETFTVADLTAAALFYRVVLPPQFPIRPSSSCQTLCGSSSARLPSDRVASGAPRSTVATAARRRADARQKRRDCA
jgi:glutathione S-transferase